MSEELQGVLLLIGPKAVVEAAASRVEQLGWGDALAREIIPIPDECLAPDGEFVGPPSWMVENWGCRGFALREDAWWNEPAPGGDDDRWSRGYNLYSWGATPNPVLVALSRFLPDIEVHYILERWDTGDYDFAVMNGEVTLEQTVQPW